MSLVNLYYNENFIRYDFLDESISNIKEKLFAFDENIFDMYPPFIKLITDENVVLDNDSLSAVFYIKRIEKDPLKVNIVNLINDSNIPEIIVDDSEFLSELNRAGYKLSETDLQFYKKLKSFFRGDQSHKTTIENYINRIHKLKESLLTKYNNMYNNKYYSKIYELSKNFNINEYIDDIYYNMVDVTISGNNISNGVGGRFIDLDKVFNIFELSDEIPYIAIGRYRNDPVIKVHNSLKNNQKLVNNWVLKEKKKANIVTYKKVKGLLFKVKYKDNWLSVNVLYNGLIEAKINYDNDELPTDLNSIKTIILKGVQYCIDKLNILSGVFFHSKKLDNVKDSKITVNNISGECATHFRINKNKLRRVMNSKIISDNFFNLKETIGTDILSIFYVNHYSNSDTKGVITNIKDNKYKLDSSIINVFSAMNSTQIRLIIEKLVLISLVSNESISDNSEDDSEPEPEQIIREKSKIKDLKKKGIATDSKNCQKDKQPSITGVALNGSYTLEYKNVKYVCPNPNYKYPGFTNKNIVCCFKKDQRGRENFLANTNSDSLELLVAPSNKIIRINDTFKTHPLKVVSEYIPGFDENNSVARYYYLDNSNQLIAIKNDKLINNLENEDNIWLEPISLSKLVNSPPKQFCLNIPNLKNKSNDDLNKPCKHHSNTKIFGYTNNSYPCCFMNNKDPIVSRSDKKIDITREHILKHDKLLQHQRIGELDQTLDQLFNNQLNISKDSKFYRMGVIQNNNSLYNAILLSFENEIKLENRTFNNTYNFKKYITDNYGILELPNLITTIEKLLNIKIYILEKHSDNSLKLLCTNWYTIDSKVDDSTAIVLFRNNSIYELLINVKKSDIIYKYPSDSKIVKFLSEFETKSCIIDDKYPSGYPYIPMFYIKELIITLDDIIGQVTSSGKVLYAINKKGFLIPVKESDKLDNLKNIDISAIRSPKLNHSINDYINYYNILSKKLNTKVELLNVFVDDSNNIISATTSFGQTIPIKETPFDTSYGIPKNSYKYYEIDTVKKTKDDLDESTEFYKEIQNLKMKLYNTKKEIAGNLSSQSKKDIVSIIKNTNINRFEKIKNIYLILLRNTSQLINNELEIILYQISNDILNDNVENLLLNNIVISEFYNPNELIKRDSESILQNINEIKQFFI